MQTTLHGIAMRIRGGYFLEGLISNILRASIQD